MLTSAFFIADQVGNFLGIFTLQFSALLFCDKQSKPVSLLRIQPNTKVSSSTND
ncbi:hypothetical protein [Paenibacillus sp. JMULE4]|uniref:hypothetical protein n=1 Tax=Paenibacillus sp. JMULE4 TaxID=2518342 RepID=UPI00157660C0|nr:hypothetical protein [Paenibacillus sp. JMULE4]